MSNFNLFETVKMETNADMLELAFSNRTRKSIYHYFDKVRELCKSEIMTNFPYHTKIGNSVIISMEDLPGCRLIIAVNSEQEVLIVSFTDREDVPYFDLRTAKPGLEPIVDELIGDLKNEYLGVSAKVSIAIGLGRDTIKLGDDLEILHGRNPWRNPKIEVTSYFDSISVEKTEKEFAALEEELKSGDKITDEQCKRLYRIEDLLDFKNPRVVALRKQFLNLVKI